MQSVVLPRQLLEPLGDVFRHLRRGVGGLLVEGNGDAVFAVELGVDAALVVRDEHLRHVLQPDRLHALHAQIEQDQLLQFLPCGDAVAHGHHVLHAVVVRDIPRRHGEVLRRQQGAHGAQLQHILQIRLLQRRGAALLNGSQTRLQLGQGAVYLNIAGYDLLHAVGHGHGAGGDLLHHARQHGVVLLEFPDLLPQKPQLLLQPLDLAQQMLPVLAHGGQAQVDLRQLRLHLHIAALGLDGGDLLLLLLRRQEGIIFNGGYAGVIPRLFRLQLRFSLQEGLQLRQPFAEPGFLLIHVPQAAAHRLQRLGGRLCNGVLLRRTDGRFGVLQLFFCLLQLPRRRVQLPVHRLRQPRGERVHFLLAQDHVHLPLHQPAYGHAGHARDALHLARQRVFHELGKLRHVHLVAGHGGHGHRQHGGVNFQHIGRAHGVVPAALESGDLLLDVHARGVHIHALLKLQHHHGHAVLAGGADVLDLVEGGHGLLHGLGDVALHGLGAGARVGGHDDHIGEVHIGQQIRRHFRVCHHAQHQYGQHRHEHRQRLFHAEFCHNLPFLSSQCSPPFYNL